MLASLSEQNIRADGGIDLAPLNGRELHGRASAVLSGLRHYHIGLLPHGGVSDSLIVVYGTHQGMAYRTLYLAGALGAVNILLVPAYHGLDELAAAIASLASSWRRRVALFAPSLHAQASLSRLGWALGA
jgi:hypothetical protein